MSLPPTVRVFIAGSSGSGKSTAAWRHYLSRFPRRIIIDLTGEWEGQADATVYDVDDFARVMRKLAPRGRWTLAAGIGADQLAALVAYLIPVPTVAESPVLTVGGAVILVDEVDLVAPPRSLREEVRTLWRRSRHVGLSVVATTQRPEAVSREVSAQSHHVLALHMVEPAAMSYMADIMRYDLSTLPAWWGRHPHGGLWRDLQSGATLYLTEAGTWEAPLPPKRAEAVPHASAAGAAVASGELGAAPSRVLTDAALAATRTRQRPRR